MWSSMSTGKKATAKRGVSFDSESESDDECDFPLQLRGAYKPSVPVYHFQCALKLGPVRTLTKANINTFLHDTQFPCSIPCAKGKSLTEVMEYVLLAMKESGISACASHFELAEACGRAAHAMRFTDATFELARAKWKPDVGSGRNKLCLHLKQEELYRTCRVPGCTLNVGTGSTVAFSSAPTSRKSRYESPSQMRDRDTALLETKEKVRQKLVRSGAEKVKERLARVSGTSTAAIGCAILDPNLLGAPVIASGLFQTDEQRTEELMSTSSALISASSSSSSSSSTMPPTTRTQQNQRRIPVHYSGYVVPVDSSKKRSFGAMQSSDESEVAKLRKEVAFLRKEVARKK